MTDPRTVGIGDRDRILLRFPYDTGVIASVKVEIPGARWDPEVRAWWVAQSRVAFARVIAFAERHRFAVTQEVVDAAERLERRAAENLRLSGAVSVPDPPKIPGLEGKLYPYQEVAVAYGVRQKRVLIADDLGSGKTFESIATVEALKAWPAIVVCLAVHKEQWRREILKWFPDLRVAVMSGTKPDPRALDGTHAVIINFDVLHAWVETLRTFPAQSVIVDECSAVRHYKARRTRAVRNVVKGKDVRLFLSATPIVNRPNDLLTILQALGRLEEFGGFWAFRREWDGAGPGALKRLNRLLRETCYIRRVKGDILKDLPPLQRVEVPVEIDNLEEYLEAERDLARWLTGRLDPPEGTSVEEIAALVEAHLQGLGRAEAVVRLEALKQIAARGKVRLAKEWITNALDSGEKLVVFFHHREVGQDLAHAFPGCARIMGGMGTGQIEAEKARFQTDQSCRLCLASLQAGGVGHTLTSAAHGAFLEYGWTPMAHDQAEGRLHRIGQESPVTMWYLVAMGTVEEDILELVDRKREVVSTATEGRTVDADRIASVEGDVMKRVLRRGS